VYISTGGLAISGHHCHGQMVSISFFGVASDCYGNKVAAPCEGETEKPFCKKGCCEDSMEFFKSDSGLDVLPLDHVDIKLPHLAAVILTLEIVVSKIEVFHNIPFHLLKPPPVEKDILLMYQVFLC
jgi:hypothetical protein